MIRAIVYATNTKEIRRIIVCDTAEELIAGSHAGEGETLLIAPDDMPINHYKAQEIVVASLKNK